MDLFKVKYSVNRDIYMNIIGNHKSWINPEWIDFLENNRGTGWPKEGLKYEIRDPDRKFSVV